MGVLLLLGCAALASWLKAAAAEPSALVLCRVSPDAPASWSTLVDGATFVSLSPSTQPGQCVQAGGSPLGGPQCQGACVFLGPCTGPTRTTWNVSLTVAPTAPGSFTVLVAECDADPTLIGWVLVTIGGPTRAQLWPKNQIGGGGAEWVQDALSGALYIGYDTMRTRWLNNVSSCCGTDTPGVECSGHGVCNVDAGACTCTSCYSGSVNCSALSGAAVCTDNGGSCDPSGVCTCDGCSSGLNCETPATCSGFGTCTPGSGCTCGLDTCVQPSSDGLDCVQKDCGPASSCLSGLCACPDAACYSLGPDGRCAALRDCGHGTCAGGNCVCESPCWSTDQSGACTVPFCINGGQCAYNSSLPQTTCTCQNDCFGLGATGQCDVPKSCGAFGTCSSSGYLVGWDDSGFDLGNMPRVLSRTNDFTSCWALCNTTAGCISWSYAVSSSDCGSPAPLCWLKSADPIYAPQNCRVAGEPGPSGGPGGYCECADLCGVLNNGVCDAQRDCGVGASGPCNAASGGCTCTACYSKDARGACTVPLPCGAGSAGCDPVGGCTCLPCWSLDGAGTCSVAETCSNGNGVCDQGEWFAFRRRDEAVEELMVLRSTALLTHRSWSAKA